MGDLAGKIVIDCTNPLRMGATGLELEIGHSTSGGERVAGWAQGASVFKTLNQTGFEIMGDAEAFGPPAPVMFVAGDDEAAKPRVMDLVRDLGFEAVDAGPLTGARLLEGIAMLWIHMAINRKAGRQQAFAQVRRA
jgi:predicted dinucleotide-binding enzyme